MKSEDRRVLKKMIKYCNDIEEMMVRFQRDFHTYQVDIAFQYSCNMCIIQIEA